MSLENALALVEQVRTLHLMPSDRIFVKVPETTRPDEADKIAGWFREQFPDHKVILFGGGIDVSIIREGSPAHEAIRLLGYDGASDEG